MSAPSGAAVADEQTYSAVLSVQLITALYSSLCPHLPTCYFVTAASKTKSFTTTSSTSHCITQI